MATDIKLFLILFIIITSMVTIRNCKYETSISGGVSIMLGWIGIVWATLILLSNK